MTDRLGDAIGGSFRPSQRYGRPVWEVSPRDDRGQTIVCCYDHRLGAYAVEHLSSQTSDQEPEPDESDDSRRDRCCHARRLERGAKRAAFHERELRRLSHTLDSDAKAGHVFPFTPARTEADCRLYIDEPIPDEVRRA